jgi:microcystin-dependent protein
VGTIMAFAGAMDVAWLRKQGWLYCDGALLPKADYPDLFGAIGTNYGGGGTSFNLPDLRGRFCRGVDNGKGRDPYANEREPSAPGGLAGDAPGSVFGDRTGRARERLLTAKEDDGHTHAVPHAPKHAVNLAFAGILYAIWRGRPRTTTESGRHVHELASGGDHETRPLNKDVFFVIKWTDAKDGER